MATTFRQKVSQSETSAVPTTVFLPSDPLIGSTLLAVVGCTKGNGIAEFRDFREWNLLFEADGPVDADERALEAVRVQIWAAFDISSTSTQIGISFPEGTIERGVIITEYIGDTFKFPNPADRVVGDTGVTAAGAGTLVTGASGETRESVERWDAAGAVDDPAITFQNPLAPFAIVTQIDIGAPAAGRLCHLNTFQVGIGQFDMQVDHTAGAGAVNWAATAVGIRGVLQVPFVGPDEPVSGEPVTENTDHEGDAIGHLLEQFKSHDKR